MYAPSHARQQPRGAGVAQAYAHEVLLEEIAHLRRVNRLGWLLFLVACTAVGGLVASVIEERCAFERQIAVAQALLDQKPTPAPPRTPEPDPTLLRDLAALPPWDAQPRPDAEGIRVALSRTALFGVGGGELSAGGMRLLDRVGAIIKQSHPGSVTAIAHLDGVSTWDAAATRAVAVARYLVDKVHLNAGRMAAAVAPAPSSVIGPAAVELVLPAETAAAIH